MDQQYKKLSYQISEREHHYGKNVHLFSDPYLLTRLARLCHSDCVPPETNVVLNELYTALGGIIASQEFPRVVHEIPTRMKELHAEGAYIGEVIDPNTPVTLVGLARAGTLPAIRLFEMYAPLMKANQVRVDHIFINRSVNSERKVTGATIHGSKIGGPVTDSLVIFPDIMGATGSTLSSTVSYYKKELGGQARRWISLNLIVTLEFISRIKKDHPEMVIYSLRLDRGLSSKRALESIPGEFPDEEKGLNEQQYIVPGGGGFGEILSGTRS